MPEIILLALGQAGAQISNSAWELLCLEHGIKPNGQMNQVQTNLDFKADEQTFFQETSTGQRVPRAVIIDLEPTVVDEIRTGVYQALFHPDQLITTIEDASNNYARGYYSVGRRVIHRIITQIRRATEACDMFQGFFIINSFGGGTGSGLTSLLLNHLATTYVKQSNIQVGIYPGPRLATGIVEPYNSVLAFSSSIDQTEMSILLDNESLYNLCQTALQLKQPTFLDINRLISLIFSCLTISLRSESSLNVDLVQLKTNLVPFPRIHFPILSHAPFYSKDQSEYEEQNASELTHLLFEPRNQMLNVDLRSGRTISCCVQYRGDISFQDVIRAIKEMKNQNQLKFVDWCPTGFKLGIASKPPMIPSFSPIAPMKRSATLLMNTSAVNQAIQKINCKFDQLYRKRAFVHWYVSEGMEEAEFQKAREDMTRLERDYVELLEMKNEEPEEEEEEELMEDPKPKKCLKC